MIHNEQFSDFVIVYTVLKGSFDPEIHTNGTLKILGILDRYLFSALVAERDWRNIFIEPSRYGCVYLPAYSKEHAEELFLAGKRQCFVCGNRVNSLVYNEYSCEKCFNDLWSEERYSHVFGCSVLEIDKV